VARHGDTGSLNLTVGYPFGINADKAVLPELKAVISCGVAAQGFLYLPHTLAVFCSLWA
jgi:hypothetical protein